MKSQPLSMECKARHGLSTLSSCHPHGTPCPEEATKPLCTLSPLFSTRPPKVSASHPAPTTLHCH